MFEQVAQTLGDGELLLYFEWFKPAAARTEKSATLVYQTT